MKYIIFAIFIFVILFNVANAQIFINEIQISPTDQRFIELYNSGDEDIDLTDWYIQRKTATGSSFNSLVTSSDFESKSVKAGEYFLISRGLLLDSDITVDDLTLTEHNTLRIRNSEREDIDQIQLGEIKEGESYQRISDNNWASSLPTPKSENTNSTSNKSDNSSSDTNEDENQTQTSSSNENNQNQKSSFPIEPQIFAYAGEDRSVPVGADTIFEGKSFGLKKEPLANARYVWNFGNLEIKEGQNVLHYYKYPGEYVVILNVSSGEYSASDRIIVNAYPAELVISNVNTDFIEIHNKSNRELNLSWWQIQSEDNRFTIPKDTIILPNKKLIFSSDITKLNTKTKENISLLYPNGTSAIKFEEIKIPQNNPPAGGEDKKVNTQKQIAQKTEPNIPKDSPWEIEINQKDITQTASVISNISTDKKDKQIYKWLFILFGIIAVSVGIIIYVSDKKEPGDDIEIIE